MRRVIFAELLLSFVIPPDRASATAGDLLESSRGTLWFFWSLAGTVWSAIFREMSMGVMFKAIALSTLLTIGLRLAFGATLMYGGRIAPELKWLGPVLGVAFLLLHPIVVGLLMARRLPGKEVASWMAVVLAMMATSIVWWNASLAIRTGLARGMLSPVSLAPLLLGVLLARRTTVRNQRKST